MDQTEKTAYLSMNEGIGLKYLDMKDRHLFALGTIIKISVISGCLAPTDPEHQKVINNELIKLLLGKEEYSTMTVSEIACAFRFNSMGNYEERIEHYQNVFNLDYFGKVMELWLRFKRRIQVKAALEEMKLTIYEPKELFGYMEPDEVLNYSKQKWSESENLKILSRAYDSLKLNGFLILNKEEKETISNKANDISRHLLRDLKACWLPGDDFLLSEKGGDYLKEKLSKKIAVAEYFEKMEGSKEIGTQYLSNN